MSGRPDLREEFRQVALVHADALYRIALRLTGDETEAEDLVQEVCLKAYRAFRFLDPQMPCRNWLFRILHNTWISVLRKDSRSHATAEFDHVESICESAHSEMEVACETFDIEKLAGVIDDRLKVALERLPERFRVVLLLSSLEGMSYAEIAEITGVPIGTVMSRLYRARRMLKKDLWQHAKALGYVKDRKRGM